MVCCWAVLFLSWDRQAGSKELPPDLPAPPVGDPEPINSKEEIEGEEREDKSMEKEKLPVIYFSKFT